MVETRFKKSLQAQADAAETTEAKPHRTRVAKAATSPTPAQPATNGKVKLHFSVNGKRMGSPPGKGQNSLSGIAYFHTKACVVGKDRLTVAELEQMLAALKVADPSAGGWEVTLPNGKTIKAEVTDG